MVSCFRGSARGRSIIACAPICDGVRGRGDHRTCRRAGACRPSGARPPAGTAARGPSPVRLLGGERVPPRSRGVHPGPRVPRRGALRGHGPARRVLHSEGQARNRRGPAAARRAAAVLRRGHHDLADQPVSAHLAVGRGLRVPPRHVPAAAYLQIRRRRLGPDARRRRPRDERRHRHPALPRSGDVRRAASRAGQRARSLRGESERARVRQGRAVRQPLADRHPRAHRRDQRSRHRVGRPSRSAAAGRAPGEPTSSTGSRTMPRAIASS